MTKRDEVWVYALTITHRVGKPVTHHDVVENTNASERTARDTLRAMENNNFIVREQIGNKVRYIKPPEGI